MFKQTSQSEDNDAFNLSIKLRLSLICLISPKKVTHFAARNAAEDEEDVIERNRTEEIQKEPSPDVVVSNQLRIDYYLLGVVLLHYSC